MKNLGFKIFVRFHGDIIFNSKLSPKIVDFHRTEGYESFTPHLLTSRAPRFISNAGAKNLYCLKVGWFFKGGGHRNAQFCCTHRQTHTQKGFHIEVVPT